MRLITSGPGPLPATLAAVVACCVLAAGCSIFTRSIERPTADVRDVAVSTVGWSGVAGELRLDVSNPNGPGVPLAGIEGSSRSARPARSPARSSCRRPSPPAAWPR
ncbi:MAG: hypothetical protein HS111_01370 [Kofleriaceae bacterium]|nr:hypothetical protein [Kofleriaceae bacterium]